MDIVFVTPEIVPFSKATGIGDVVGALPKALRALGHRVHVVSLLYGSIDPAASALARRLSKLQVPLGNETLAADLYETRLPSGVHVTLLAVPGVTDRGGVYGEADDDRRFALLSRGAVEWLRVQAPMPSVVHAHDWPAALVPAYLRMLAETDPRLASIRTVLTLHQTAAQGVFGRDRAAMSGLSDRWLVNEPGPDARISWLRTGITHADRITLLSSGFARDLLAGTVSPELHECIAARARETTGIQIGVDFAVWNPTTDPHLVTRYDAEQPAGKARCKADLQTRCNLALRPDVPLFAWIGRFDHARGIDALLDAAPALVRQSLQLVLLGEGDDAHVEALNELARRFPERVHVRRGFDDAFAHQLYAAADFYVAPSREEPSGLSCLYAMRYGTVPVVRPVGGHHDAAVDCDSTLETGTAFVIDAATGDDLQGGIARALGAYENAPAFAMLRRRVMRRDFSWERSARRYAALYEAMQPAVVADTVTTVGS